MSTDSQETDRLLIAASAGDALAVESLFSRYRNQLLCFVTCRFDRQLASRLDASDIVQETQKVLHSRLSDYLDRRHMPFRDWAFKTALDCLSRARRTHVLAEKRTVRRESLPISDESSVDLTKQLVASVPSPLDNIVHVEVAQAVRKALLQMSDIDREVLVMRYLDGLNNQEISNILSLGTDAVSMRHGRALRRLHRQLARLSNQNG